MAFNKIVEGLTHAAPANVDLSEKLHYFAKIASDGDIDLAGDGTTVAGVIVEAAALGKPATIQFGGIGKVIAAEAIDENARLASDSAGKAVNAAAGDFEVGTAVAAAASGELCSFIFASGRRHA